MYEHISAHQHSSSNRQELAQSTICGCFYCLNIYAPTEIDQWVNEDSDDAWAICAHCNVDSVIGDASGYPITREFLQRMYDVWFDQHLRVNSLELVQEENLEILNRYYLGPVNIRVVEGEKTDLHTRYIVEEKGAEVFTTLYPDELLVKVAQILPNSQVRQHSITKPARASSRRQRILSISVSR